MGMVIKPSSITAQPPRASKQIDRDTAVRYRAVPADQCQIVGDYVQVPRKFMVMDEGERDQLLLALQTRVEKMESILRDLGHGIVPSAQVLPMRRNAKASEQSEVGVSVSGNEAEVLSPENDADQPVPTPKEVPEDSKPSDTSGKVVQLPDKAANDSEVESPPIIEETKGVGASSADTPPLASLLWETFGWTGEEIYSILRAEYDIRDAHCRRKHNGVSYTDLRLLRAFAKDGIVGDTYHKSQHSKFAEFWKRTAGVPRVPDYENPVCLMMRGDSEYAYMRGMATTPKAYKVRELRRVQNLKLALRERQGSAQFQRELRFAQVDKLAGEPKIPFNWAAKRRAMAMKWLDRWDVVRGWFGRPPVDRSRKAREQIEAFDAAQGPDLKTPTAELVRRCQRQGISH